MSSSPQTLRHSFLGQSASSTQSPGPPLVPPAHLRQMSADAITMAPPHLRQLCSDSIPPVVPPSHLRQMSADAIGPVVPPCHLRQMSADAISHNTVVPPSHLRQMSADAASGLLAFASSSNPAYLHAAPAPQQYSAAQRGGDRKVLLTPSQYYVYRYVVVPTHAYYSDSHVGSVRLEK